MVKLYLCSLLTAAGLLLAGPAAQAQARRALPPVPTAPAPLQAAPGGGGVEEPPYQPAPEQSPWSHLIDSLTAHLDRSRINSGILYDRALPLAGLHAFGQRQADTTSSGHLRQAYLELWMAAYNRPAFRYSPSQLRERANRVIRHDTVPIGVLDYQFHYLDTLALRDGLLQVQNGLLYDVAAPSRSPWRKSGPVST